MRLVDAADVLDDLAAGRPSDRAKLIAGALALQTLVRQGRASRDILDAAAGIETVATGGILELEASGRERAVRLAIVVRNVAGNDLNT